MLTFLFLLLAACILTHSQLSLHYALLGLELWFQKMIPSLLPFMILSGIMVRIDLTEKIAMAAYPLLKSLYQIDKNVCYCMLFGFLCGFPMGAKVTAELLERDKLTLRQAEYLLAFCNNIGPVYFLSFVLPLLNLKLIGPYLFGMYGLPLLYGLILRYTAFRDIGLIPHKDICLHTRELHACEQPSTDTSVGMGVRLLEAIDQSIRTSVQSMLMLGGYMILFNLLNLIPHVLLGRSVAVLAPLLEITGGLGMLKCTLPLYSLIALSFGGLSCIAQTYSCIRSVRLSLSNYIFHKVILTLLTVSFYLCWFFISPETFLL